MNTSTDRIERKVLINAPRARVWRALSDAGEFGDWFGVNFKASLCGRKAYCRERSPTRAMSI